MNDYSQQEHQALETVALKDEERQPCEIWTRVMGYHRPVSSFNTGKKGEYYQRRYFLEARVKLSA